MEDQKIIKLLWHRAESALEALAKKYHCTVHRTPVSPPKLMKELSKEKHKPLLQRARKLFSDKNKLSLKKKISRAIWNIIYYRFDFKVTEKVTPPKWVN